MVIICDMRRRYETDTKGDFTDKINNSLIPRGMRERPVYTDKTCTGICIYRVASVAAVGTDSNLSTFVKCNIEEKGESCTYFGKPVPSDPTC